MITKKNETKSFRAEKKTESYYIAANVVTDSNNAVKHIDAGEVFLPDESKQIASFGKFSQANTSITFLDDTSIAEVAAEIALFINEVSNNIVE